MTGHDIISAQTGQVFSDDHVDLLGFDVTDHTLEIRSVKIGAAPTVIDISVINRQSMFLHKIIQEGFLVVDAF